MDPSLSPAPQEGSSALGEHLEAWLADARRGSSSALGRALEAGRKYLLLVANRALDDKLKAKLGPSDLVQDTFADAHRDFGQFRGTTEKEFYRWLLGILAHRLANTVRRYRQTQSRDVGRELPLQSVEVALSRMDDEAITPGTIFVEREEQRRVRLALERLGEPWRSILVERTWQGAPFAEIGARRNRSADAARKMWARAVREMRNVLATIE